jgi:large subunit ribosomal protein L3
MLDGMIGRKLGMMRLYDGSGRVHGVTVIELGPNRVTQVRTKEHDGYEAVQLGFTGNRKRLNRPERGHLRRANVDAPLSMLKEFRAEDISGYVTGQEITVSEFGAGQFVNVTATSKGKGFAGGVKRWNFRGGPKTHGQSDRHRAPGSVGAGTTPGRTWRGQKMAGHMGAEQKTVLNLLVVLADLERGLLFVEGSVPGPRRGIVTVTRGRKPALAGFDPPVLPSAGAALEELEETASDEVEDEAVEETAETAADEAPAEAEVEAADAETEPAEPAESDESEAKEKEASQ